VLYRCISLNNVKCFLSCFQFLLMVLVSSLLVLSLDSHMTIDASGFVPNPSYVRSHFLLVRI